MKCSKQNALIIIPDVHGRPFWRYPTVTYRESHFIFLGDFLDPYPEDHVKDSNAYQIALDIFAFKRANPDRVTLILGNHDLHYMYDSIIKGSRYDEDNAGRNRSLFLQNQELFQMAYETAVNGRRFLFTHAGVGKKWLESFSNSVQVDFIAKWLNNSLGSPDFMAALNHVSSERGGWDRCGSMIWGDVHEYLNDANAMENVTQIFGHTRLYEPMNIQNKMYCLDCGRAFYLNREDELVYDLSSDELVQENYLSTMKQL